ncbi:hypothetical protein CPB85DRAFT_1288461 [Mucidula mucida]|nr:hypothetical protein CPB85DRAFT_1288461 [Mucidula mucida]
MSNYNYKQALWHIDAGAGDIGAQTRAQIAKAVLTLNDHQDVVLALSSGGYTTDERPQIALLVAIDYDMATLLPAVESALAAEGLAVKATLQSNLQHYDFGSAELSNIAEATKVVDLGAARQAIDKLYTLPLEPISAEHADVTAGDPSPTQIGSFAVQDSRMRRLRDARNQAVEDEIQALKTAFVSIKKAIPCIILVSTQMLSGGILSIGPDMFEAYKEIAPKMPANNGLASVLSYILGLQDMLSKLKASIDLILSVFEPILKDKGVNILLLVNGHESVIKRVHDHCPQEEQCAGLVLEVESAFASVRMPGERNAFSCGFYFYRRTQGPDACCMGVEFNIIPSGTRFSVGMICRNNNSERMSNSIRVTSDIAPIAAELARKSEMTEDTISVGLGGCTVSRANPRGPINFGICYLE